MEPLKIPEGHEESVFVVSVSGGKDSTATWLRLRESGIECRAVFADTGWEAPETYAYLDTLRSLVGPIDVVGVEGGMRRKIRERAESAILAWAHRRAPDGRAVSPALWRCS